MYYPCFISFRHFGDVLSTEFIHQFLDCLKGYLRPLIDLDPFIDFDRMQPGYRLKPSIADALCKSACMVVIWSPQYFSDEHIWCAMEYKAMTELQNERLKLLPAAERSKNLIIPVIYKGSKYYPQALLDNELYLNFEKFALYETTMIRNKQFADEVEKLANYIYERIRCFKMTAHNPWGHCEEFSLPSKEDTLQFIESLNSPHLSTPAFPFR